MILPPLVIDVHVREAESRGFRIWLPFVLLWPLLLILVGVTLMVSVFVDFVLLLSGARYHHYTLLVFSTLKLLAETRGTNVHVAGDDASRVDIDIY